jgi:hypothetical protein
MTFLSVVRKVLVCAAFMGVLAIFFRANGSGSALAWARDGTLLAQAQDFLRARAGKSARGDLTRLLDKAPGGSPSPEDVV